MPGTAATLVTQTRVREGKDEAFAQWQQAMSQAAAECRGFIEQSIMPPSPPAQTDWVILQRFASDETAVGWLRSDRRLVLLAEAQPLLVGPDDVHLVRDTGSGVLPAPISVVISTRIKPGCETEFRRWEQKIATAQARSVGFQGYRFEPPVPGIDKKGVFVYRTIKDLERIIAYGATVRKAALYVHEALEDLGIQRGQKLYALVKAVSFDQRGVGYA